MADKKTEKKDGGLCLKVGFWSMLVLFLIMMVVSILKWQWPTLIAGVLFVISVLYVFVMSIKMIAPEGKSMAYIALGIAILFILYILLSMALGLPTSGAASGVVG
jgi:hypothetical protein